MNLVAYLGPLVMLLTTAAFALRRHRRAAYAILTVSGLLLAVELSWLTTQMI